MPTNKFLPDKQQFITDILNSDESLQHFIDFWSRQYKYAFYSVLELYSNNPQGTFFAETKQWNKAGRYINPGSVSISLHFPDGSRKNVFDISQTHGKEISIWRLPAERCNQFFLLPENDGIPADTKTLMRLLLLAAEKEIPSDRLQQKSEISLASELASHIAAARFDIHAPDLQAEKFETQSAYNIFVASHLAARNLIRRAEIFAKGIETNKALSIQKVEPVKVPITQPEQIKKEPEKPAEKENRFKNGSKKDTPVFHAPKQEITDNTPEQLTFGMAQNNTNDNDGQNADTQQPENKKSRLHSDGNQKPAPVKMHEIVIDLTAHDVPTVEKIEKVPDQSEPVNYQIPDDYEPAAGQKGKYKDNIAAIRLLKQLESEERSALPEEQTILARYNGGADCRRLLTHATANGQMNTPISRGFLVKMIMRRRARQHSTRITHRRKSSTPFTPALTAWAFPAAVFWNRQWASATFSGVCLHMIISGLTVSSLTALLVESRKGFIPRHISKSMALKIQITGRIQSTSLSAMFRLAVTLSVTAPLETSHIRYTITFFLNQLNL